MIAEAASAGFYELGGRKYPRLQIITIEDALKGRETGNSACGRRRDVQASGTGKSRSAEAGFLGSTLLDTAPRYGRWRYRSTLGGCGYGRRARGVGGNLID